MTAALDPRVKAVVPFNFGGPQPDYAVPDDPARDFYWFGVPSWEPTRCLRLGARDGFAQWLIVGSVAPRRLMYAHEFAWDRGRDPAWPRLQQVFGGRRPIDWRRQGRGMKGTPPESLLQQHRAPSEQDHRSQRWFGVPIPKGQANGGPMSYSA